jgi:hypothetical protein
MEFLRRRLPEHIARIRKTFSSIQSMQIPEPMETARKIKCCRNSIKEVFIVNYSLVLLNKPWLVLICSLCKKSMPLGWKRSFEGPSRPGTHSSVMQPTDYAGCVTKTSRHCKNMQNARYDTCLLIPVCLVQKLGVWLQNSCHLVVSNAGRRQVARQLQLKWRWVPLTYSPVALSRALSLNLRPEMRSCMILEHAMDKYASCFIHCKQNYNFNPSSILQQNAIYIYMGGINHPQMIGLSYTTFYAQPCICLPKMSSKKTHSGSLTGWLAGLLRPFHPATGQWCAASKASLPALLQNQVS